MFKSWSLQTKLQAICMSIAAMVLISGAVSYFMYKGVIEKYQFVTDMNLPTVKTLADMNETFLKIRISVRAVDAAGLTHDELAQRIKKVQDNIATYLEREKAYLSLEFMPGEKEHYEEINKHWTAYKAIVEEIIKFAKSDDPASKEKLSFAIGKTGPEISAEYDKAMDSMSEFQTKQAKDHVDEAKAAGKLANTLIGLISALCFVVAFILGFVFSKTLSNAIRRVAGLLSAGADEVASAASEISSTSEELSASATEQAASLQETASSVEEMNAMVNKNAENAAKSTDLSTESQQSANEGKRAVEQMIHAVEEINQSNTEIMSQIEASNQQISEIVKVIAEIGNKTKVINDIVFQTKLLSFNASVEAARAGEHGKGFAVVAEEVGNLAQMSGNAAKEISSMLEGSIQKVEGIVTDTKTKVERLVSVGKEKVEAGAEVARRCGEVLDKLVDNVGNVNARVTEISTASQEQARGVSEITRAMTQLDQVTQQNSASSQQAASAAEQLSSQAEILRTSVQSLLEQVNGAGHGHSNSPAMMTAQTKNSNVVPFKKPKDTATFKKSKKDKVVFKKAAGGGEIPSADDPHFEE